MSYCSLMYWSTISFITSSVVGKLGIDYINDSLIFNDGKKKRKKRIKPFDWNHDLIWKTCVSQQVEDCKDFYLQPFLNVSWIVLVNVMQKYSQWSWLLVSHLLWMLIFQWNLFKIMGQSWSVPRLLCEPH